MKFLSTYTLLLSAALILAGCDPCKDADCQNSYNCYKGTCECLYGYEGERCEILTREKMLGTYKGTYSCAGDDDIQDYIVEVMPFPDERTVHKVAVQENGEEGMKLCEITGTNTFSLEYNLSGSFHSYIGEVNGDELTITFKAGGEGRLNYDCSFKGVRQ